MFYAEEVFFRIDADGIVLGFGYVDGDAIFEEAELFQSLDEFQGAGAQGVEAVQGFCTISVEAKMLPGRGALAVAIVGDGGAGEVEGSAVKVGDDFDGVGVGDVFGGAGGF